MNTITAKEFLENTFELGFLLPAEVETLRTAMELFAQCRCNEQRELCFDRWLNMPELDDDSIEEYRLRGKEYILNAPQPIFEL